MQFSYRQLNEWMDTYGDAFYLLDSEQFRRNYAELKAAFSKHYSNFNIAYSYKTNYTPKLCKIVDRMGGYAEVVSDMEMEIALRIGGAPEKIIWNGPYKNLSKLCELLLLGGTVNLDSAYELPCIARLAKEYPNKILHVGIRCNFEVNDGVVSRFGFDTGSEDFRKALALVEEYDNLHLIGLQCHFASRNLKTWKPRAEGMLALIDRLGMIPEHIDLGGGLFGKMEDTLKTQFDSRIPSYEEYAKEVAPMFAKRFGKMKKPPLLLIEPGSALVGDCMKFVSRVINIKTVRGKPIATLSGSVYNINPTLHGKNPPITVFRSNNEEKDYDDLDFGGYTCIESDYLYRHYKGSLAAGDIVVFGNVGSYSVVLKPPFILPNFAVLDICGDPVEVTKRSENFDDLFRTFHF